MDWGCSICGDDIPTLSSRFEICFTNDGITGCVTYVGRLGITEVDCLGRWIECYQNKRCGRLKKEASAAALGTFWSPSYSARLLWILNDQ